MGHKNNLDGATYERTYLCSGKRKQNNSIEPDRQFCEKQFFVDWTKPYEENFRIMLCLASLKLSDEMNFFKDQSIRIINNPTR